MNSGMPKVIDQEPGALDRRRELERGDGPDLVPADHARASRTTRRKMSSIGASVGSKRSMRRPGGDERRQQVRRLAAVRQRARATTVSDSRVRSQAAIGTAGSGPRAWTVTSGSEYRRRTSSTAP